MHTSSSISDLEILQNDVETRTFSASTLIELIASRSSSSVFVYDLADHVGIGNVSKGLSKYENAASVVELQTRSGAGLSLLGRLSREGCSKDINQDTVLTAFNTPIGLSVMAPVLAHLTSPTLHSRLVLQIPSVTQEGPNLVLSPTLAHLQTVLPTLSDSFAVLVSATPQESLDLATLSYKITSSHVIHIFDHHSSAREVGPVLKLHDIPAVATGTNVEEALRAIEYNAFDYVGDADATTVVVMLNGPLALTAKAIAARTTGFAILVVRLLRPWNGATLRASLPASIKVVHVVDDVPTVTTQGHLYSEVFSAILETETRPKVRSHRIIPSRTQEFLDNPTSHLSFLSSLAPVAFATSISAVVPETNPVKKLLFFGTPTSPLSHLPEYISRSFIPNRTIQTRLLSDHDIFSKPGGVTATRLLLSAPQKDAEDCLPPPILLPLSSASDAPDEAGTADFLAVLDQALLKTHTIVKYLKRDSPLLIFTSWSASELISNLSLDNIALLRQRSIKVFRMDTGILSESTFENSAELSNVLGHLTFLRLYLGQAANEALVKKLARGVYAHSAAVTNFDKISALAWASLEELELPISTVSEIAASSPLKEFHFNAISAELLDKNEVGASVGTWREAAKHLLFPDSFYSPHRPISDEDIYTQNPALHPESPDRTYLVTCTVNRRLTPIEYDRNVFHLEFDSSGTGLKYAIGEALGIHGWNDTDEVLAFCDWYGVDLDQLLTIPVPSGEGKLHTRTIFQALQQQIDIFGRPPKSFYPDLAQYATQKEDRLTLQFIGSPEGSSTFKKLSEKDTVTFADVLRRFKSARPGIEVLCEMIGDIKPRHYSIASAQSVVGDRIDLLIVTVDWVTPSGSPRYGQCTRYLAGLKVGQKVTVSIKPSVMKLPPDDMQPIILAGLGTGAAPFRAFLQHRAALKERNIPVGPLYYYFGSRHRSQEYLYGEEIEAFILDKVITHAGLAFSRDQKKKIYIQNKMAEDGETLARMLREQDGVFYLCGPTWPVPDVYEILVGSLVKHGGMKLTEAAEYLEGLKEEERYVLEVY